MSRAIPARDDSAATASRRRIDLGIPRFSDTRQVASLFGFSEHWMYKLNKRGNGPPHLQGVRPYRYDTWSTGFYEWLETMGVQVWEPVGTKEHGNV